MFYNTNIQQQLAMSIGIHIFNISGIANVCMKNREITDKLRVGLRV